MLLLLLQDLHKGGNLLHWVKTRDLIETSIELDCELNLLNLESQTPLHVMVKLLISFHYIFI